MRTCTFCKEVKAFEEFSKHKGGQFGLSPQCKACNAEKYLRYKEEHPENLEASRLKARLKRYYNMTPDQYYQMLEDQNGVCAICGSDEPSRAGKSKYFAIDHDHVCCPGALTCGQCVRGLICDDCNILLGRAKDTPSILRSAARYLESWLNGD